LVGRNVARFLVVNFTTLKQRLKLHNLGYTYGSAGATAEEKPAEELKEEEMAETKTQERDWRLDEDFKKFMSNPSIETAVKLEKKRAKERLRQIDNQEPGNFFQGILNSVVRNSLEREKGRLELNEDKFIDLDVSKVVTLRNRFLVCLCSQSYQEQLYIISTNDCVRSIYKQLNERCSKWNDLNFFHLTRSSNAATHARYCLNWL
jgi:hypothetical protein